MKIRILSDLHLEFSDGEMDLSVVDDEKDTICILAGDIGVAEKASTYIDFLSMLSDRFQEIIYILGNHEYYHGKLPTGLSKIQNQCKSLDNVHILENETLLFDNIAFVCATLWSNFDDHNPGTMIKSQLEMNDFRIIRTGPKSEPWKRKFTPNDAYIEFQKSKSFIFDEVIKHKEAGKKVVVVTHHAPSFESVSDEFKNDKLNGAYASNLEKEILDTKPMYWIHGHTHASADYIIGDTRVILNPRGYHGYQLNDKFDPLLTIDV